MKQKSMIQDHSAAEHVASDSVHESVTSVELSVTVMLHDLIDPCLVDHEVFRLDF